MVRKFKPGQLFDGNKFKKPGSVLITSTEGKVEDIVDETEAGDDVEMIDGIITPGFINCHCHLELSHLKNVIPPHTGLIEFLCSVVTKRGFDPGIIQDEIIKGEKEMFENGIVAVGDIGNTSDTATVKERSKIRWQNFVEVLSFTDEKAAENIAHYRSVAASFPKRTTSSLVPHAPYSISPLTFRMINDSTGGQVISMHNQEHPAEDELYRTGSGDYLKLFRIFGINASPFPVTGTSSIRSVLPHFNSGQTIFLVHNTYMPEADIDWALEYASRNTLKLVFCFCVNANLYIENRLPQIDQFIKRNCDIVLGTDSYSSNWQLSIGKEVHTINKNYSNIPLESILHWATLSGARALRWENELGSFEKGKTPGVVKFDASTGNSGRIL